MNQHELYDRQSRGAQGIRPDYAPALVVRDAFVIDRIRTQACAALAVAELSIGEGRMTEALLRGLPHATLTCAEIASARIEAVRQRLVDDPMLSGRMPTFVACNFDSDFGRLPSAAFHAVVALDIMEHVVDVFGFVEHCHRILRADGMLYLRVPNLAYLKHRVGLLLGRLPVTSSWYETPGELHAWREQHGWDGGHLHQFTIPMLERLLREGGFTTLERADPGTRFQHVRKLWPEGLYANPVMIARKDAR